MEIVSSKLSLTATSPPGSLRGDLVRNDTFSSSQRQRWNGGSSSQRASHRRRESLTGGSLMSLKAYYRKLRTFKGTIKALISFRRMPSCDARTGSVSSSRTSSVALPRHAEDSATGDVAAVGVEDIAPKISDAVAKLNDGEHALQTVQHQVQELVDKGHVVTELDPAGRDDVAYRMQGNLDHYTEENMRKRLQLQEHPHMVALTQRLWLAATHEQESQLSFAEYEAYMLRLHRLILPEFDLTQSRALIKDDWTRDTDGRDHLDFRFFHFSMFELVDLWTDTVDAEDYISLLYVIMHCLTFTWNDRRILKDLDEINQVDILEASKNVSLEEIERDLERDVNSESAQMYRDRIACEDEEEEPIDGDDQAELMTETVAEAEAAASGSAAEVHRANGDGSSPNSGISPLSTAGIATGKATTTTVPGKTGKDLARDHSTRKPSGAHSSNLSADMRPEVLPRTPSSPSRPATEPKPSRDGKKSASGSGTTGASVANAGAGLGGRDASAMNAGTGHDAHVAAQDSDTCMDSGRVHSGGAKTGMIAQSTSHVSQRLSVTQASGSATNQAPGSMSTDLPMHGQKHGGRTHGSRTGSVFQRGPPRIIAGAGNQYGVGSDSSSSSGPISITSFGAGSELLGSKTSGSSPRKTSSLLRGGSSASFRQGSGMDTGNALLGLGLHTGHGAVVAGFTVTPSNMSVNSDVRIGCSSTSSSSTPTSPRAPHPPSERTNAKESESRQGSLLVFGDQQRAPPIVYGKLSPRARSANSQSRILVSPSAAPPHVAIDTVAAVVGVGTATGVSMGPSMVGANDNDNGPHAATMMMRASAAGLTRPATSSSSSRNQRVANHHSGGGALTDYLKTRAYQEPTAVVASLKVGRPLSRADRLYQQRASQSLVQDLAVSTLISHGLGSSGTNHQHARPAAIHLANNASHQSFAGSVLGAGGSKLSFEATTSRLSTSISSTPRASLTKIGRMQGTHRQPIGGELQLGLSLRRSGNPAARLELHTQSLTPRKSAV